ncbi:ABC transporter ATP-binding protein [Chloroflexota bacterium]
MYDIQELTKVYALGKVSVRALDGVSFTVEDGDILAIMGRSGSGKSTLLRQMGLLDMPTSGTITLNERDVTLLPENKRVGLRLNSLGYIFQEYALLSEMTAHQNVYLPGMMLSKQGVDYKKRAAELLELVGLGERLRHLPKELSGGEQQRVAIARSLINDPLVLLADEPCANLDTTSAGIVMETLVRLNSEIGVTIIFVSHDPDDRKYARSEIVLGDGKIIEESEKINDQDS